MWSASIQNVSSVHCDESVLNKPRIIVTTNGRNPLQERSVLNSGKLSRIQFEQTYDLFLECKVGFFLDVIYYMISTYMYDSGEIFLKMNSKNELFSGSAQPSI